MKKFNICVTLSLVTCLGVCALMPAESFAEEAIDSSTLTDENMIVSSTLPDKTLIVGTHAIDLAAINDEVLNVALDSISDEQDKMYYKSDLNSGTWYDISNSNSITEISVTRDNIVSDTLIDELPLEFYTSPDGVTYKMEDSSEISISLLAWYDYPSEITELSTLLELKETKTEELVTAEGQVKAQLEDELKSLNKIFALITDLNTDAFSEYIGYLDVAIDALESDDVMTFAENSNLLAQKIWLENRRNAYSYEVVLGRLNDELSTLDVNIYSSLFDDYTTAVVALESGLQYLGGKNSYEIPGDEAAISTRISDMVALANMTVEALAATVGPADSGKTYDTLQKQALCQMIVYAKNGDNYQLLEKSNELSLISSLSQGIMATDENDIIIEEKILNGTKELAIEVAENLSNNAGADERLLDVLSDGSSEELVSSVQEEISSEISEAVKSASAIDETLMSTSDSSEEQLAILDETVAAIGEILTVADDEIVNVLSEVLEENLQEIAQAQTEIILNDSEEYEELQEQLAETVAEKNILYQENLELLDAGNIDDAVEKRDEASAAADTEQTINDEIAAMESDTLAEQLDENNGVVSALVESFGESEESDVSGETGVVGDDATGNVGGETGGVGDDTTGDVGGGTGGVGDDTTGDVGGETSVVGGDTAGDVGGETSVVGGDTAGDVGGETGEVGDDTSSDVGGETGVVGDDASSDVGGETGVVGDDTSSDVGGETGEVTGDTAGDVSGETSEVTGDTAGDVSGETGEVGGDTIGDVSGETGEDVGDATGDVGGDGVAADSTIVAYANVYFTDYGKSISSGIVVQDDEVYLSVRSVSDILGAKLMYDSASQTYIMHASAGLIEFVLNSKTIYVNDKKTTLKLAPNVINTDVAYLPLSTFETAFKLCHVESGSNLFVYKY